METAVSMDLCLLGLVFEVLGVYVIDRRVRQSPSVEIWLSDASYGMNDVRCQAC